MYLLDIDECAEDIPKCDDTKQCINEKGSFTCVPKKKPPPTLASTQRPYVTAVFTHHYKPQTFATTTKRPLVCSKGFTLAPDGRTCVGR